MPLLANDILYVPDRTGRRTSMAVLEKLLVVGARCRGRHLCRRPLVRGLQSESESAEMPRFLNSRGGPHGGNLVGHSIQRGRGSRRPVVPLTHYLWISDAISGRPSAFVCNMRGRDRGRVLPAHADLRVYGEGGYRPPNAAAASSARNPSRRLLMMPMSLWLRKSS